MYLAVHESVSLTQCFFSRVARHVASTTCPTSWCTSSRALLKRALAQAARTRGRACRSAVAADLPPLQPPAARAPAAAHARLCQNDDQPVHLVASLPERRNCSDALFLRDDWPGEITWRPWQFGDAHQQQKSLLRARLARCGGYTGHAVPHPAKAWQKLDMSFLQALTEVGPASDGRRLLFPPEPAFQLGQPGLPPRLPGLCLLQAPVDDGARSHANIRHVSRYAL